MTESEFTIAFQRLQAQVADAAKVRKEFQDLCQSVVGDAVTHENVTKNVITAYLKQTQSSVATDLERLKKDRDRLIRDSELVKREKEFCEQVQRLDRAVLENTFREKSIGFPTLSKAYADYLALRDERIADYLTDKAHPACKAAEAVRQISTDKHALEERCRQLQYQLLYYEVLFPALSEYREIDDTNGSTNKQDDQSDDPAKNWLTAEEYAQLPTCQKYQRALDHYWTSPKSSWRLGRDYERYIGYLYEIEGYKVQYQGIIAGFEDAGRDLICRKGRGVEIVQCKYWAQKRIIHEKHINQLFGTCVKFWIDERKGKPMQIDLFPEMMNDHQIVACFTTSTKLSDTAKQFASALNVKVRENLPLKRYPCIKCNVSRTTSAAIYHLPFDLQYDNTVIETDRGECYVDTVAEAERLGFRRAFVWHNENPTRGV